MATSSGDYGDWLDATPNALRHRGIPRTVLGAWAGRGGSIPGAHYPEFSGGLADQAAPVRAGDIPGGHPMRPGRCRRAEDVL